MRFNRLSECQSQIDGVRTFDSVLVIESQVVGLAHALTVVRTVAVVGLLVVSVVLSTG